MSKSVRVLAAATVVLALALAAPVQAMPIRDAQVHNSAVVLAASASPVTSGSASRSSGLDWDSAAVGAGGIVALIALISGGLALAGRARPTTTR